MLVSKLEKGMKLYGKPVNNRARWNKEISEFTVSKVGRKYFWLEEMPRTKFEIENLSEVTEYAPDWELYFTKQEILDEQEFNDLVMNIRLKFDRSGRVDLTLDQLRRINAIIEEN